MQPTGFDTKTERKPSAGLLQSHTLLAHHCVLSGKCNTDVTLLLTRRRRTLWLLLQVSLKTVCKAINNSYVPYMPCLRCHANQPQCQEAFRCYIPPSMTCCMKPMRALATVWQPTAAAAQRSSHHLGTHADLFLLSWWCCGRPAGGHDHMGVMHLSSFTAVCLLMPHMRRVPNSSRSVPFSLP